MAGVPLAALEATTGGRTVRAMPNAAAERGASYTPWLAGGAVTRDDRTFLRALLARIGTEDEVTREADIDLLTALSGSGAAYPALMAAAMLDQARASGLTEPVARRAVEAAICDGAEMLRGRIEAAPELVETYRAYRGTTAAGLDAAEERGFSKAIAAALEAGTAKAGRMWPPTPI
jgi:pyrroline-5-carboxylate reductase